MENALRRFKRRVQQEDVIKEIKKHSYYMKPGEKAGPSRRCRASGFAKSSVANWIKHWIKKSAEPGGCSVQLPISWRTGPAGNPGESQHFRVGVGALRVLYVREPGSNA